MGESAATQGDDLVRADGPADQATFARLGRANMTWIGRARPPVTFDRAAAHPTAAPH
jgi:hypothetical protein